jgi:hypothetical protein
LHGGGGLLLGLLAEAVDQVPVVAVEGGVRDAQSLCVPKTLSTSCDQAIFVDQATDASLPSDAVVLKATGSGSGFSGAAAFRER